MSATDKTLEERCAAFAELELKHIQLELNHGRANHMRSFVDQYLCYRDGYVRTSGAADWNAMFWQGTVSKAALAHDGNFAMVVKEHAVPLKVINAKLRAIRPFVGVVPLPAIKEVVDRYGLIATITKEEDAALRARKLNSAMPLGFEDAAHRYFDDPWSRYADAGIEFVQVPRRKKVGA